MGILPLQFEAGADRSTYALTGEEIYEITGIEGGITPRMHVNVNMVRAKVTGQYVNSFLATREAALAG